MGVVAIFAGSCRFVDLCRVWIQKLFTNIDLSAGITMTAKAKDDEYDYLFKGTVITSTN